MPCKGTGRAKDCGDCQRLQAQVEALESLVVSLRAEATLLREQLAAARQGTSTSSKPPSSDIVKPPKPAPRQGRPSGDAAGSQGTPVASAPPSPRRNSTAASSTI